MATSPVIWKHASNLQQTKKLVHRREVQTHKTEPIDRGLTTTLSSDDMTRNFINVYLFTQMSTCKNGIRLDACSPTHAPKRTGTRWKSNARNVRTKPCRTLCHMRFHAVDNACGDINFRRWNSSGDIWLKWPTVKSLNPLGQSEKDRRNSTIDIRKKWPSGALFGLLGHFRQPRGNDTIPM